MPKDALLKLYADLEKLPLELDKVGPLEKRVPKLKGVFDRLRDSIRNTSKLTGCVFEDCGLTLRVYRHRKAGSAPLLPPVSLPMGAIVTSETMAFLSLPLPYESLWHASKAKGMDENPKGWRKLESWLNQLFDYASFEEEILPQIGPQTSLVLNMPSDSAKAPVRLPRATLLLRVGERLDLTQPIKEMWQLAIKNEKVRRHFRPEPMKSESGTVVRMNLQEHPLAKVLQPGHATTPGWFLVGSHCADLPGFVSRLAGSACSVSAPLNAYVRFPAVAHLLRINADFLQKEAEKKGREFSQDKFELGCSLLEMFEDLALSLSQENGLEVFELSLHRRSE
jgi:hypothetical protein